MIESTMYHSITLLWSLLHLAPLRRALHQVKRSSPLLRVSLYLHLCPRLAPPRRAAAPKQCLPVFSRSPIAFEQIHSQKLSSVLSSHAAAACLSQNPPKNGPTTTRIVGVCTTSRVSIYHLCHSSNSNKCLQCSHWRSCLRLLGKLLRRQYPKWKSHCLTLGKSDFPFGGGVFHTV